MKLAGLHPVIRAVDMGRRRHSVDDRASVEIQRARTPWRRASLDASDGLETDERRIVSSDALYAKFTANLCSSLLHVATAWRFAREVRDLRSNTATAYGATHEGYDTVVPRVGHVFKQKLTLSMEIRTLEDEDVPTQSGYETVLESKSRARWKTNFRLTSALRGAGGGSTPRLSLGWTREAARWTVAGETAVGGSGGAGGGGDGEGRGVPVPTGTERFSDPEAREVTLRARRVLGRTDRTENRTENGFAEITLSIGRRDVRAFAVFKTARD